MGLTRRQTFLRVELPLAMPAIHAGLRIAVVATISIATVAAFSDLLRSRRSDLRRHRQRRISSRRSWSPPVGWPSCSRSPPTPSWRCTTSAHSMEQARCARDRSSSMRFSSCRPCSLLLQRQPRRRSSRFTALGIASSSPCLSASGSGHRHRGLLLALGAPRSAARSRASRSSASSSPGSVSASGTTPWRSSSSASRRSSRMPTSPSRASTATSSRRPGGWVSARRQILTGVELPLGLPLLLAGVRIAAVFVIATATIAGIAGGGGLGEIMAATVYNELRRARRRVCASRRSRWRPHFALSLVQRAASRRMAPRA